MGEINCHKLRCTTFKDFIGFKNHFFFSHLRCILAANGHQSGLLVESEGIKRDLTRLALKDSRFSLIRTLLAGNGSVSDIGGRVRDRGTGEATCP